MTKQPDRNEQAKVITECHHFKRGEPFTVADIASQLCITSTQARDILNTMASQGLVEKRHERTRQGGARSGTMTYKKPPPMILRKAWRKCSNESIGVA